MMQQYDDAKSACGDAILLFRMGDFYELFNDDARIAARELGLTLTSRDKGENATPMAGFPHHQLDTYLAKLISAGHRAAVCDQVEDPKQAKGLVKREVTRVVTPGTVTDDALLDPRESNYLAAVVEAPAGKKKQPPQVGVAWADISTGRFHAAVIPRKQLDDQLARISPAECLISEKEAGILNGSAARTVTTTRPAWTFASKATDHALSKQFDTASMAGFGFNDDEGPALRAAGAVLDYLAETQRSSLAHFNLLAPYRPGDSLEIDEATRRSLELTRTLRDGRREGSLLEAIDRCGTSMGSRLLADWLANPLTQISHITARQDAVEEFLSDDTFRREMREMLSGIYDLERLTGRAATGRATPRDLNYTGRTLAKLPAIKAKLTGRKSPLLQTLQQDLDLLPEVRQELESALQEDCPISAREGGIIRTGFNEELDKLRELATGGKQWIAGYQAEQAATLEIPNLKVGFNNSEGYYLEVTKANLAKVPETYSHEKTLKNATRYSTPELRQYAKKVVTAEAQALELEYTLFTAIRDNVQTATRRLQAVAKVLAQLDVLAGLADLARRRAYCRPVLVEDRTTDIVDGRHPVLDITLEEGTFVPNDCHTGEPPAEGAPATADSAGVILLITGPNMAGKSTYIRQVALLAIMAQMGSFVPARSATIGVADRVFARVGASDELSRGQSTFMVEMTETARILNTATSRSLVILDEIGRGTSTYDGVSLAWAIVEHLHNTIGCRTLFATHYHELTDLRTSLGGVKNLNVAVKEWDDNVVFLHKIVEGAADKSYGIHVARLAGVPRSVNERAKQILAQLESEHLDESGQPKIKSSGAGASKITHGDLQLTLFAAHEHPLLETIRETDVNSLTPLESMQLIQQWQQELSD